jgi:serine/threonine-protein kinase
MSDEQFEIGSVLDGRYRIDAVLGTGGMGRVYRAEHTKIGKVVAIKVLHADLGRNREAAQRFQREAMASGRLDHPNIVGVSDFGVFDDGACYLVMEVLEGESLGDRLARDHRIHWAEAIDILRGVLAGLRHAHDRGVVHRDIKPDNVYLAHKDGEPVIKILDFGIAKLYAGTADDPAATRAGLTVGTPAYLSPEQAVGGEITPASDLYSASIVLYEMLAGRAPFEDKDPLAMLGAHVGRRPPAFAEVAPGVEIPAPLEEIVQRGLMKAATERISTASDYLAMLDAFSPSLQPGPPRFTSELVAPSGEWSRRMTPVGMPTPVPRMTPVGTPTPVPGTVSAAIPLASTTGPVSDAAAMSVSVQTSPRPGVLRKVSPAEVSEPVPRTWIVRSGVVVGLAIVGAIVLAIATRCGGFATTSATKGPAAQPSVLPSETKSPAAKSAPSSGSARPAGRAKPGAGTGKPAAAAGKPAVGTGTTPATGKPAVETGTAAAAGKPAVGTGTTAAAGKPAVGTGTTAAAGKPAVGTGTAAAAGKPAVGTGTAAAAGKPAVGTGTTAAAGKPAVGTGTTAAAGKPAVGTGTTAAAGKPAVGTGTTAAAGKPAIATGKPVAGAGKPVAGVAKPLDRDAKLKQLLNELQVGKTCVARKATIRKLVELHDARALPPLRRASANWCLKADADRAIKELSGTHK